MRKKYIFYIDSMQMGGAQRVMNNLIDYFVAQGVDVKLVNDIIPSNVEPEYTINKSVKRYFLDETSIVGVKKNLKRIIKLRKIIKNECPDLVLSFLGPPNIRMLIASRGLKTKKVVSVRNDPIREYGSGLLGFIAKMIFLLADGCVFQTEDAKKFFFSKTQEKSKIIFNPVNLDFYEHQWTGTGKNIVLIGRLQKQKNPILALEAFSKIADEFPMNNLVFYGDEELTDDVLLLARNWGLDKRVYVAGKTDKVGSILEDSALYILSSDYEGMPNALMEAMTVGVPVISTDCPCGGPRMLIKNETQGILVPCGDSESMADAMRRILSSTQLQNLISENERMRAKMFYPERILGEWREYLGESEERK